MGGKRYGCWIDGLDEADAMKKKYHRAHIPPSLPPSFQLILGGMVFMVASMLLMIGPASFPVWR